GLTHAAFSLSSGLVVWGVRIEPAFHVQVNRDAATRRVRLPGVPPPPDPDVESGLNTWWTFIVSPVRLLGFGDRS
ncbi:MAG: hypothetical protein MJB57_14850, partial [Gemmatimonadetes bacterium]|nr:hypothetical protein [Gemmatimonadota bacterium]